MLLSYHYLLSYLKLTFSSDVPLREHSIFAWKLLLCGHLYGKGIMTTVPAWCVSAHAVFVFKIDSQKTQCLLIALNKMQLLKKIILYVEVIF